MNRNKGNINRELNDNCWLRCTASESGGSLVLSKQSVLDSFSRFGELYQNHFNEYTTSPPLQLAHYCQRLQQLKKKMKVSTPVFKFYISKISKFKLLHSCCFIYTLLLGPPYTGYTLPFLTFLPSEEEWKLSGVFVSPFSFLPRERNPHSNTLGEQHQIYILRGF